MRLLMLPHWMYSVSIAYIFFVINATGNDTFNAATLNVSASNRSKPNTAVLLVWKFKRSLNPSGFGMIRETEISDFSVHIDIFEHFTF